MTMKKTLAALAAISILACNDERKAQPEPPSTISVVPPGPSSALAPNAPPPPATTPQVMASVSGTVAETMDAGGYTYIRIKTSDGEKWAAVPQTKLAVGDKVTVANPMVMKSFASPTLKRTFDEILFGTLAGAPPSSPSASSAPSASATARASAAPSASAGPIAKAPGPTGKTVAEIFAGKAALKDKQVSVRGRVVKFNAGILGKNWLHIVDGTGTKAGGDNDLAVTTAAGTAEVGDVVLVRGVLHLDKDFGGGYTYGVIVEDATIEK